MIETSAEEKLKEIIEKQLKGLDIKDVKRELKYLEILLRALESLRESIEGSKKRRELVKNFHARQISFLERNKDKKFEISPKFYDAALRELERSFRWGEEMGMLIFFREQEGRLYGDEFYDSKWITINFYGNSTPFKVWVKDPKNEDEKIPYPLGSFGFNYKKLYELTTNNPDKLLLICHTHPSIATPSKGDLRMPYCGIIIGFEKTSPQLRKLVRETFYKGPKWKKEILRAKDIKRPPNVSNEKWEKFLNEVVGKEVIRQVQFDFSKELYDNILKECSPTLRLFYTDKKGKLQRIPLYVDGRELK